MSGANGTGVARGGDGIVARNGGNVTGAIELFLARRATDFARAVLAQEWPRVDTQVVAVVPVEANGIASDGFGVGRAGFFFKHGQRAWSQGGRLAGSALCFFAFVVTESARAGIAQEDERVAGVVAVLPGDLEACSASDIHLDGFRIVALDFRRAVAAAHGFSIPQGDALACVAAGTLACRVWLDSRVGGVNP